MSGLENNATAFVGCDNGLVRAFYLRLIQRNLNYFYCCYFSVFVFRLIYNLIVPICVFVYYIRPSFLMRTCKRKFETFPCYIWRLYIDLASKKEVSLFNI